MTRVIVDAETPAGIASAATAAPSKSNFLTIHSPSAVGTLLTGFRMCAPFVNDAGDLASPPRMKQKTATARAAALRTKPHLRERHTRTRCIVNPDDTSRCVWTNVRTRSVNNAVGAVEKN